MNTAANGTLQGILRTVLLGGFVAAAQKGWLPGGYDYANLASILSVGSFGIWSIFARQADPPKSALPNGTVIQK